MGYGQDGIVLRRDKEVLCLLNDYFDGLLTTMKLLRFITRNNFLPQIIFLHGYPA